MIEMLIGSIGGILTPTLQNLIKGIFDSKTEKTKAQVSISENAVRLAEIQLKTLETQNAFDIERQKTIAATALSGVKWVDGLNALVRVIIGLTAAALIVSSIFGTQLIDKDTLKGIVMFVVSYYFAERSCQKVY